MKAIHIVLLLSLGAAVGGAASVAVQKATTNAASSGGEREILYYRNPMDPSITSPEPRKDHMGMDYVPVYADSAEAGDGDGVRVAPGVLQSMNVRLATVEQGDLTRQVRAVGYVDFDESGLSHVHLRTEAWIEDLRVRTTGEQVERGQVLFRMYSPALINAQEELLQVVRSGADRTAARERLAALGLSAADIRTIEQEGRVQSLVPMRARQRGSVQELSIREGMQLAPGTTAMELADLSRVWLLVDLFPEQAADVQVGSGAAIRINDMSLSGTVDFIYPALDTATRTVRARITLDNPDGRLRPGMYADVDLQAGTVTNTVHVPAEAVIRTGSHSRVVVALGEGRFAGRAVKLGRRFGDRFEIREGLEVGESVVASGHFLIDSESNLGAELRRMEKAGPQDEPRQVVWAEGKLISIDRQAHEIRLAHEPIPELQWPEMTMDFSVDEAVALDGFAAGQVVRFRMIEGGVLGYTVTAIEPID
ncbi:hypothetical protein CAI21_11225 [Alkalilimnicola ehrlichii]|uniref:Uncharacterized protein n=1 Tax=Alkalilimnicola ehrlichii TaxID=351052 RepID=A0A3E0WZX4_9GAMM|nr:efflux RND transporter periplasmic adaptor subunit [Alkalilimnicola ehrlichii]RFA29012.1 hypothetical protein CAI21_11225 [Alkalilimnicola ehrlichii]RFA38647.1 hypothetical protein CAL65_04775 [Alkalilimnicola ehrlichii]